MSTREIERTDSKVAEPDDSAKRQKLSSFRFYGDEFVFDTVSGLFYRISPTGSFILRSLMAGAEMDDLPGMLQDRFGIDPSRAARDVALFLNELAALDLPNRLKS